MLSACFIFLAAASAADPTESEQKTGGSVVALPVRAKSSSGKKSAKTDKAERTGDSGGRGGTERKSGGDETERKSAKAKPGKGSKSRTETADSDSDAKSSGKRSSKSRSSRKAEDAEKTSAKSKTKSKSSGRKSLLGSMMEKTKAPIARFGRSMGFTTDYKTRDPNAPLPVTMRGQGLGGCDLPVGGEDAYRHDLPPDFMPTDLVLLPPGYCYSEQPTYLRREAADSLLKMFDDAACQGLCLKVFSGYRDYRHQQRLYYESVGRKGRRGSGGVAKPGHSEHALGTTVDLTSTKDHVLSRSFGNTPEGQWMARNGPRYGWILTVVSGEGANARVTEPWHFRYVGPANAMARTGSSRGSSIGQKSKSILSGVRSKVSKMGSLLGKRK